MGNRSPFLFSTPLNDSPPLRLVRLITWLPVGGIERRLVAVLPRLDAKLFKPEVICLRERGPLADDLESAGVPVEAVHFRSRLSPPAIWRLRGRLHGAAIVHSHMYRANVPGTIAARMANVPVIIGQIHNVDTWERPNQIRWERRMAQRRDATIAVSERVQRNVCETLGISPDQCPVLHNGVDLTPFQDPGARDDIRSTLGIEPDEVVMICAARLHPQKNHAGLLEAVASLPSDLPPWRLLLAGDGPVRADVVRMIGERGLEKRVSLTGSRDDMPRVLHACDISVLASEKEGFSNAVVESLAAGLPMVATDVGGNAEAIAEGETGYLVPPGDMRALSSRLAGLICNRQERETMGERARRSANQFSIESMVRKTELLYLRLLKRKRPDLFDDTLTEALQRREAHES